MPAPKHTAQPSSRSDPLGGPALSASLRALAQRGVMRGYRKGTLLIQEGDHGDTIYIILNGRLRSFGTGPNGREITYGTYGPGEYVGEMSLDGGPRSASVETVQASTCVTITRTTLMAHIGEHPEFALELLAKVIRRARAATLTAKQMAVNDVYGRLRLMIEQLAVRQGDADYPRVIPERPTHLEVARYLGCSREMVSRLLKDLERGGLLVPHESGWRLASPLPPRW